MWSVSTHSVAVHLLELYELPDTLDDESGRGVSDGRDPGAGSSTKPDVSLLVSGQGAGGSPLESEIVWQT